MTDGSCPISKQKICCINTQLQVGNVTPEYEDFYLSKRNLLLKGREGSLLKIIQPESKWCEAYAGGGGGGQPGHSAIVSKQL